jgi:hypothetical protein
MLQNLSKSLPKLNMSMITGRMLLSHNFDVSPEQVPALSPEEFVNVFQAGLSQHEQVKCRQINHPHWILEIRFNDFSPTQIGEFCAKALTEKRRSQNASPEILILGGLKTTPPTSDSPDALQPGDWGVDVVETSSKEVFLQKINWDSTIADKPAESIFKIEV